MENSERVFIPYVTINPSYLCMWERSSTGYNYNRTGLENNSHEGEISAKASKRLRTIITWFSELTKDKVHRHKEMKVKYRLTFATLTLPAAQLEADGSFVRFKGQLLTDDFIKRNLLNRFFVEAKRKWKIVNYLWRAEAQENGNIHFHITFDKFVFHADLKQAWNNILRDWGFIDRYRNRMKQGFKISPYKDRTEEQQQAAYEKGLTENFSNPNSTDIHSIYKIKNIGGYLSKYVSKNLKIYQFKSKEQLWKIKKALSSCEGFISLSRIVEGFKAKFSGTKLITVQNFVNNLKIEIIELKEKIVRAITGRLWYCSRSLRALKNITLELTQDVFCGINEMMNSTPHTEHTPMIKNKVTGEMEPNRFVKVFLGDFLKITKTQYTKETETHEAQLTVDYYGSWYGEHIVPLLKKITGTIKEFFTTQEEELIAA